MEYYLTCSCFSVAARHILFDFFPIHILLFLQTHWCEKHSCRLGRLGNETSLTHLFTPPCKLCMTFSVKIKPMADIDDRLPSQLTSIAEKRS